MGTLACPGPGIPECNGPRRSTAGAGGLHKLPPKSWISSHSGSSPGKLLCKRPWRMLRIQWSQRSLFPSLTKGKIKHGSPSTAPYCGAWFFPISVEWISFQFGWSCVIIIFLDSNHTLTYAYWFISLKGETSLLEEPFLLSVGSELLDGCMYVQTRASVWTGESVSV